MRVASTDVVHHHIHPAFAGQFQYLPDPVRRGPIHHDVGTERLGLFGLVRIACHDEYESAGKLRDLNGHAVHPAPGADDKDGFPRPQAGPVDEHAPGGQTHQQRRGGFRETHSIGQGGQVSGRNGNDLGRPAAEVLPDDVVAGADGALAPPRELVVDEADPGVDHHALADAPAGDPGAQGQDLARDIRTAPVGHLQLQPRPSAPDPDVQVVQGAGPHADHHLAGRKLGVGHVTVAQHIQFAVLLEIDGFHRFTSVCGSVDAESRRRPGRQACFLRL